MQWLALMTAGRFCACYVFCAGARVSRHKNLKICMLGEFGAVFVSGEDCSVNSDR